MKKIKALSLICSLGAVFALVGCKPSTETSSVTSAAPTSSAAVSSVKTSESAASSKADSSAPASSAETSVIKSITAKNAAIDIRIGETVLMTNLYTILGTSGTLTAAQKACTYVSSDTSILTIVNKTMKAVTVGAAKLTITSKIDTTKSCEIAVTVKDVYFDRDVSTISSADDFSKELPADGGIVETKGSMSENFYVKGISSTKWYMTSDIVINSVASSEKYPKFGIVTNAFAGTESGSNNMVTFFLNAWIGDNNNASWTDFGVCEVQNGTNWGWNAGVAATMARHKDVAFAYSNEHAITLGTKWSIAVARDGMDFHVWVDGNYVFSMTTLGDLMGNIDNGTTTPVASMVGLFEFNADATYSNYSATATATDVDAKIATITTKTYIDTWDKQN
jgi:hypothetical protein